MEVDDVSWPQPVSYSSSALFTPYLATLDRIIAASMITIFRDS